MDTDNLNSTVINWSMAGGTWCTKSLRASDVIGIYWAENWDALSPLELRVPSGSSFISSFQPFSTNKPYCFTTIAIFNFTPLILHRTLAIHSPKLSIFPSCLASPLYTYIYSFIRARSHFYLHRLRNNSFNFFSLVETFFFLRFFPLFFTLMLFCRQS